MFLRAGGKSRLEDFAILSLTHFYSIPSMKFAEGIYT